MTIEEQAKAIEQSYAQFHRMTTQPQRTEEDRREDLQTLKDHLTVADRTLCLPPSSSDTANARSKLILWSELTRETLREMGQPVVMTDTQNQGKVEFTTSVFGKGGNQLVIADASKSSKG